MLENGQSDFKRFKEQLMLFVKMLLLYLNVLLIKVIDYLNCIVNLTK